MVRLSSFWQPMVEIRRPFEGGSKGSYREMSCCHVGVGKPDASNAC